MTTYATSDDSFEKDITNENLPILVDFWAEWCGPCKQIGPILEELSNQYENKLKIFKINHLMFMIYKKKMMKELLNILLD